MSDRPFEPHSRDGGAVHRPTKDELLSPSASSPLSLLLLPSPFRPQQRSDKTTVMYALTKPRRSARTASSAFKEVQPRTVTVMTAEEKTLRQLLSPRPALLPPRVSVLSTLMEPLAKCGFSTVKFNPTENAVAKSQDLFSKRSFQLQLWKTKKQMYKQVAFLRAAANNCRFYAQTSRIFANEADAKEAYGTNVLSPLLEIANGFISKVHRLHFEVQLFSEHPQHPLYSANPIRLDHVIMLVNHRSGYTKTRELKLKVPLLGIEAKRHDLVQRADWKLTKSGTFDMQELDENVQTSLPQLLMYAHENKCSRICFTDYFDTILCQIELQSLATVKQQIPLSFCAVEDTPGRGRARPVDVFKFGPRLALAFELFEALRELGLVQDDIDKLDKRLKKHIHRLPNTHQLPLRPR